MPHARQLLEYRRVHDLLLGLRSGEAQPACAQWPDLAAAPVKAVAAILNPPPVVGRLVRAAVPAVIGYRRLSSRGATTISRGPGLEAFADSGQGLAILA
jgi:hypothetical protein